MNWPAPNLLDAANPPGAVEPPERETRTERDERRGLTAVPAAAWMAMLGTALLLVAAIGVVASNWSAIGQSVRVAALAVVTVGVLIAAERFRKVVPTTAGIVAHLGTFLTPFVAIAALSLLGFTWPACLVAGGATLVIATETQSRRWRRATMHTGQIVGWALASTGVAAVAGTTTGLVASVAAAMLFAAGALRRSAALSLLAVLSPALTALADAGIGAGTFERAGLVGERLSWSGPVVGILAATVIGSVALRRRNDPLMLVAAASPVLGLVTGLAAIDGSAVAWWCVPGLALMAAELGWWMLPTDQIRTVTGDIITAVAGVLAAVTWVAPALVKLEILDSDLAHPWALPAAVTTLAVALSTLRWRAADSSMTDLGIAAVAAGTLAVCVALGATNLVAALVAVALTVGAATLSRRLSPVAVYGAAVWALVLSVAVGEGLGSSAVATALVLVGVSATFVVVVRARLAASAGVAGWFEMTGVACAAAWAAAILLPGHSPAAAMTAVAAVAALVGILDRRFILGGVALTGTVGVLAFGSAATVPFDTTYWIGWVAAATAFTGVWLVHRSTVAAQATAAAMMLASASGLLGIGAPPDDLIVFAIVATVALTGVVITLARRTPLDAAAITSGVILLLGTGADVSGLHLSAAWTTIGLQVAAFGLVFRNRIVSGGGAGVALLGAGSFWFTTGAHEWFLQLIEPADITVADAWMAGTSLAALLAGVAARRSLGINSWVAYAAALTIPGLWLTATHLDRHPVWALPLLLTIGVAAAGLGGWHRLAAPLVGGTVLTGLGVFLATGSDLTAIPTWVWLALGGSSLLAVAVLIERTGKVGTAGLRELVDRWG